MPSTKEDFGADHIRRLRGTTSRAAFANAVGVTPQTVYRWELPDGAAEARRPRGRQLEQLERFARGALPFGERVIAEQRVIAAVVPIPIATSWVETDVSRVLPSLERVLRADLRRGHAELVQIVANSKQLSADSRGVAYFGIALCEVFDRSDARAALLALAPLLNDAEAGRLSAEVAARLFAAAALCHAFPDALLFDLGRVHAYQARVESISGGNDHEAACIAFIASLCAASLVGDNELLERAFAQLDEPRWNALPPLLELHLEEFRALRAIFAGKTARALETCDVCYERAERLGYPLVMARSLGRRALCQLEMLADPEQVLDAAQRAKALARGARMGPGFHQLVALRAELEALVRLGRTQDAVAVSGEIDAWSAETGLPALVAVCGQARLFMLLSKVDALQSLAANLRSCELPSLRVICQAYATYVEACAALTTSEEPALTIALLEQAEAQSQRWPHLLREVLLHRVYAHCAAAEEPAGRVAMRRAQRLIDGFPSPWFTAHLRRLEGALLAARGHWNEGRQMMQAAEATFELAKDRCDAALTKYLYNLIGGQIEAGDPQPLEAARQELIALGIPEPRRIRIGVARFGARLRQEDGPASAVALQRGVESLVVPFQRVAMRGAAPNLILSELVSVTNELLPQRDVVLEEIDSVGHARRLLGPATDAGRELEWLEFNDGSGRVLRLGASGSLGREDRATLSLLTTTAALALEVAVLRHVDERATAAPGEALPELPGFIAASAEMRKLRAELGRLSNSRSTVIITGESGSGKEIVARSIHELSERATRPYIAFNCATVPRELFEGQLFGYRRGSFTGASVDHPGVIRAANHGTLFLDEIGELPLDIQPKLLRFLENSEVFPLGERAPVRVDVRVLAATHRDLAALVREGRFREDLYYRLQVVPVFVPPLRDRKADVPVLARHFLRDLTRHGEPPVLAPDALAALLEQRFPGNVRELRNLIERALAYYSDQPVLRAEHLGLPAPTRPPPALYA